jgi:hypothetical protein
MAAVFSPPRASATAPIPARAKRALAAASRPSFPKQLGLGLAIFAAVLAASLPFAFVSDGLALAAAVGVGGVLVAPLARRRRVVLLIATLLAVLGAFGATHSIHLSVGEAADARRLGDLAPAGGIAGPNARAVPAALTYPARVEIVGSGGERISLAPLAAWAFPGALFALWALGFAAIAANRALLRWLWRRFGAAA